MQCVVFLEDDFKTEIDLRIAYVLLEKQVQLVNCKESAILVPQHLFSTSRDEQQNAAQAPEHSSRYSMSALRSH